MRPEVSAFHELASLVRNMGEQLARYRHRALVAERRVHDLEQQISAASGVEKELRAQLQSHAQASGDSQAELQRLARALEKAEAERETALAGAVSSGTESTSANSGLVAENAKLLAALSEARNRTVSLGERVRFVRQQVSKGGK